MTEFKRGDRIAHLTHGDGQVTEVYPSGNMEVCFPRDHEADLPTRYIILPVEKHEDDITLLPRPETALSKMVEKLDNRRPGTNGYIANRKEVVEILNSISESVSFNVFGTDDGGDIHIEIRGSFTLERDLL